MGCKVIIPSMNRADNVTTTKVVMNCIICVPESQKKDYSNSNDCEIITHPDTIKGLSLKRQWIYERLGDVFMLDDDIYYLLKLYNYKGEEGIIRDRELAYNIIQNCYENAKQCECFLFGFSKETRPQFYNEFKPIELTGYVNGCALGLIKNKNLKFIKETIAIEDYYISGLNAFYNRKAYIDKRFSFLQKSTMKNLGGLASFRSLETERNDTLFLKKCFGDSITIKKEQKGKGAHQNTKLIHKYQRTLTIPF